MMNRLAYEVTALIVTIDGPAGAGKSTVARLLAARLGWEFLDTGALYRAATFAAVQADVLPADHQELANLLRRCTILLEPQRVTLDGRDVTEAIRTPEITRRVRDYAELAVLRDFLTQRSRELAADRRIVAEGRDQGTVVFPHAPWKFFITASDAERARRRWEDLQRAGRDASFEEVLADQQERDRRDSERRLAPLRPAADAVTIDTTGVELDEVVETLLKHVCVQRGEFRPASK